MYKYRKLNKELPGNNETMDAVILELLEREEFHCTGNVCAADACGAHQIGV